MSTENDTDAFEPSEDEATSPAAGDAFFGTYSVLSPGVQVVIDGRAVSGWVSDCPG